MAWGAGGEEIRGAMKVELSLTRVPLYRLSKAAEVLQHPEKGPRLRVLAASAGAILDEIEAELNR